MIAEFEEKQFEIKINSELLYKNNIYSPGQVLENILGFDVALFTRNNHFWKIFDSHRFHRCCHLYPGIILDTKYWNHLEYDRNEFPQIKFNVILQYKRPKYLTTKLGKEWDNWKKEYYRYDITQHQQKALSELSQKTSNNCLVLYSSPVFYTKKVLWELSKKYQIVNNTNFCEVNKLDNHNRYTYIENGKYGIACSEPEQIAVVHLESLIEKVKKYEKNNYNVIHDLSENMINIILESIGEQDYKSYTESIEMENKLFKSFFNIYLFEYFFNCKVKYGF